MNISINGGFTSLLTLVGIVLTVTNLINVTVISWWIVIGLIFAPILIWFAFVGLFLGVFLIAACGVVIWNAFAWLFNSATRSNSIEWKRIKKDNILKNRTPWGR